MQLRDCGAEAWTAPAAGGSRRLVVASDVVIRTCYACLVKRAISIRLEEGVLGGIDKWCDDTGGTRTDFLSDAATVRLMADYREAVRRDPCAYCGSEATDTDHIDPKARGGGDGWENLAAACAQCNRKKMTRPLLLSLLGESVAVGRRAISLRLPDDLAAEIDAAKGDVPLQRWIVRACENSLRWMRSASGCLMRRVSRRWLLGRR